jgi:chromosome segregation ATPase
MFENQSSLEADNDNGADISLLNDRLNDLVSFRSSLETEIKEKENLLASLKDVKAEVELYNDKKKLFISDLEDISSDYIEAKGKFDDLSSSKDKLCREIESINKQIGDKNDELSNINHLVSAGNDDIVTLNDYKNKLVNDIAVLDSRKKDLSNDVADISKKKELLEKDNEVLLSHISSQTQNLEKLTSSNNDIKMSIVEKERLLAAKLSDLERETESFDAVVEQHSKQLNKMSLEKNKQLDDRELSLQQREGDCNEREQSLDRKQESLRQTKRELEDFYQRKITNINI